MACHTDVKNKGALMAGGRALKTPFGTFYSPNITADPETGIGNWNDEDFIRALREGVSPDGDYYFPVFPYPSYTKMTDQDMRDLKAYLFSLAPVKQANKEHEVDFPFGWRFTLGPWQWMNFTSGAFAPEAGRSDLSGTGAPIWCRRSATAANATRPAAGSAARIPTMPCPARPTDPRARRCRTSRRTRKRASAAGSGPISCAC